MNARLMTLADHREIESEGTTSPVQTDLQIARVDTLLALKRSRQYTRALYARLAAIDRGEIPPMPPTQPPLPPFLTTPNS